MAHTLTWNTYGIDNVNVNGVAVSQPYTLQNGDVIEVYTSMSYGWHLDVYTSSNGTLLTTSVETSSFSASDTDLYLVLASPGGGSN